MDEKPDLRAYNIGRSKSFLAKIGQQPGEKGRARIYDPKWCDEIKIMATKGEFPEIWLATIGIHILTFYAWSDKHPEFAEAVAEAWVILEAYWTKKAVDNLTNPDLRTTLLLKIMVSRFPRTWGKIPRNTFETFRDRNLLKDQQADAVAGAKEPKSRDETLKRIEELTQRLKDREA